MQHCIRFLFSKTLSVRSVFSCSTLSCVLYKENNYGQRNKNHSGVIIMSFLKNLLIDLAALTAFLIVFEPHMTGETIHEWLAVAPAGVLVVHILLHWKWVVQVTKRFVQQLRTSVRLNYIINALTFLAYVAVMLSGIMISKSVLPTLGLQIAHDQAWRMLHNLSANAALAMTALHFALHWKWVLHSTRQLVTAPFKPLFVRKQLAVQPIRVEE
jgi:hypothetical protein